MIETRTAATLVVLGLAIAALLGAWIRGPKDDNDPSQHNRRRPGE